MNLYRIEWKVKNQASRQWYSSSANDVRNMLILAKQFGCEADEVFVYEPQIGAWVKTFIGDGIPSQPDAVSAIT
jgi:hypothetical protein